jgi:hypothetical protein
MNRRHRTAIVSVVAVVATGAAGAFVHDGPTAIVCALVAVGSFGAVSWAAGRSA